VSDIDRIIATARKDSRCVSGAETRALCDEIELLRAGLVAVKAVIDTSDGVVGLHKNGAIAPWDDLLSGGRYEEWLREFSEAVKASA
jgi:hypothetical protein